MTFDSTPVFESRLRSVLGALRTEQFPRQKQQRALRVPTFVTISRQAGAGAWTLAQRLAARLNELDPHEQPWTSWDRELVERVAADHNISREMIESLDESTHSWLSDFLGSLSFETDPGQLDEIGVYRRVAWTMRALAGAGRVILVGRGGAWLTREMPGGVHVWLVAPLAFRIQALARRNNISDKEAAERVRQLDRHRDSFHRRYWPDLLPSPELFTITLGADRLGEEQMVECLVPVILPDVRCEKPSRK